jgi:hypothetical protein
MKNKLTELDEFLLEECLFEALRIPEIQVIKNLITK